MKKYFLNRLQPASIKKLCQRQAIRFDEVFPIVEPILQAVQERGDVAVKEYTERFDRVRLSTLKVSDREIAQASERVPRQVKAAFTQAAKNIEKFHRLQISKRRSVETMPGVTCFSEGRAIDKVGLYIPGGTAPLPSTVLMLSLPAKLAGCTEIVLATPPDKTGKIADTILFAAQLCGITSVYKMGGAQAIAALAFGTQSVPKVYKIFGPGNQYVTAAKMLVSIDPQGAAIDMPAGPTEGLVVADQKARADFVASDLLSQAEHGADSQVVLVTTSERQADAILEEVQRQLQTLTRKEIAEKALNNSFVVVTNSLNEAIEFSNQYAPEHLILNVNNFEKYVPLIRNAGSVFLGQYSSESAGDYGSGTNHSLPTYGYARSYSGVNVAAFQKQITFQKITKAGAQKIGPMIAMMAEQETLTGHARAMQLRYQ